MPITARYLRMAVLRKTNANAPSPHKPAVPLCSQCVKSPVPKVLFNFMNNSFPVRYHAIRQALHTVTYPALCLNASTFHRLNSAFCIHTLRETACESTTQHASGVNAMMCPFSPDNQRLHHVVYRYQTAQIPAYKLHGRAQRPQSSAFALLHRRSGIKASSEICLSE